MAASGNPFTPNSIGPAPLISDAESDDKVPDLISEEEFNQLTMTSSSAPPLAIDATYKLKPRSAECKADLQRGELLCLDEVLLLIRADVDWSAVVQHSCREDVRAKLCKLQTPKGQAYGGVPTDDERLTDHTSPGGTTASDRIAVGM
ncbi:hypothetical protein B0H13DRAFT_1888090 [Mycena leptocephala]|nr:hypothetical protein B0H13DRAFT_1888090 [Mycena leptocephala]